MTPPSNALSALIPVLVLVVALDGYCLVDLARAKSVRYAPKIVWALVILLISAPFGALAYLLLGRDHTGRDQPAPGRPAPPVLAPPSVPRSVSEYCWAFAPWDRSKTLSAASTTYERFMTRVYS